MATSLDESNLNQDIPLLIKDQTGSDYEGTDLKNFHNDDTDRDNDDEDVAGDEFLMSPQQPPPVPSTEPPPIPGARAKEEEEEVAESDEIKKALLDNMKCVENWKIEQEMLMKVAHASSNESTSLSSVSRILIETLSGFQRKYEEEQLRIEMSLKLDLEKVKEEESQRREQVSPRCFFPFPLKDWHSSSSKSHSC